MSRANAPLLSFNRGLLSPKALARTDLERTRLSAEVYENWLPKTQGAMTIRPGTKYLGSSRNDTGAEFVEFIASTDDVALVELTHNKLRVWLGSDAHALSLLTRPAVDTTLTLSDTGWSNTSTGGGYTDTGFQVSLSGGTLTLDATAVGSVARREKRVIVSDTGTEHALAITVSRGPVVLRVGSAQREDDYIRETELGTGYHNLAFTPTGNFWVTLQNPDLIDRIITSMTIAGSGTVELTTPWSANDIANVRYDQSADVVYADCDNVRPQKIERRGTGRSWSVVDYAPDDGPFRSSASSAAKITLGLPFGNTTMTSDRPLFDTGHVGTLFRAFAQGQTGQWRLGDSGAATDAVLVTGIEDTGTPKSVTNERRIRFEVSGTWSGRMQIERSIDGEDIGFKPVSLGYSGGGAILAVYSDTGSFNFTVDDGDDNVKAWYRARIIAHASGVAVVNIIYGGGGTTGIARVTGYTSNTQVSVEVLKRFNIPFDTGALASSSSPPTDNWQEGYWSGVRDSYPTAVALHGGRLAHAGKGNLFLSVSDDYESFDETVDGEAAPIVKTLGSGPVDSVRLLTSLLRLIIGTAGAEITARSSGLDEPLTPTNTNASIPFSTQGVANLRAVKIDTRAAYVQRSGQRLLMAGAAQSAIGDYDTSDLTMLVPELLRDLGGVTSIAVQRQPDSRIHCVCADGTVAILTYEPKEDVLCWSTWVSDTGTAPVVEKVAVLPGTPEDAVFYHVKRTINGATKRYLEKWAKETECEGDTGLHFLADCAKSYTDTGRTTALVDIATHLVGEALVVWGSLDTGSTPHVDLSPDVNGVQTRWSPDTGGDITLTGLSQGVHHAVAGLAFKQPLWQSTKLAYAAEAGTALAQMKRTDKIGFILHQTHNNGLFFGNDTGTLDPLPRMSQGAVVDADAIHAAFDEVSMPFPGLWSTDSRVVLRGKSPRPVTVLAAIPTVNTNEKV